MMSELREKYKAWREAVEPLEEIVSGDDTYCFAVYRAGYLQALSDSVLRPLSRSCPASGSKPGQTGQN